MNAVLYEVNNYAFDFLDGTNLLTSDKIVAIASVDGKSINWQSFVLQVKMEISLAVLRVVCFMSMI